MERVTAFEFIGIADGPQLVRLKRKGVTVLQLGLVGWIGVDLEHLAIECASRAELTIEGLGLGKPFWNGETPSWTTVFDPVAEQRRLETIREMVRREVNRATLSLQ